jgi:O-antigen ligase
VTADITRSGERLAFTLGASPLVRRPNQQGSIDRRTDAQVAQAPRVVVKESTDWGYRGLLAFTTVLLVRPQDHLPALGALHLAEISAIGALAATTVRRLSRQKPLIRVTPETIGLLVFGGIILATAPFSIWAGGTVALLTDSYLKMLAVFVLMTATLTTPARLERLVWLIVLCCAYVCAESIADYARGRNLVEGDRLGAAVGGIFGNPNDLAMNIVVFLPFAVVFAAARHFPPSRRIVALAIALLMVATVILTKSRGGALGLVAMLLTLTLLGRKVRPGFAAMVGLVLLIGIPLTPASFWNRMASILDDETDRQSFTGSREARTTVMLEGLQAFADHPLTGIGAGQFQNYNPSTRKEPWRETHNALIQVAAELGVFGLLVFSFLIARGLLACGAIRRMLAREARQQALKPELRIMNQQEHRNLQGLSVALSAGLAGWFVCALFASTAYNWTFYYLLGLVVSARDLTRERLLVSSNSGSQLKLERLR